MEENYEVSSYYGVLPAIVRYDQSLTTRAKILFVELTAVCNGNGELKKTNKYFSERYGLSNTTIAKAVNESKGGKVNYRTDKDGNVHLPIGRVSFDSAKLVENYEAIHALLLRMRPSVVKGTYVKNCVVSSTMGPAVKVAA